MIPRTKERRYGSILSSSYQTYKKPTTPNTLFFFYKNNFIRTPAWIFCIKNNGKTMNLLFRTIEKLRTIPGWAFILLVLIKNECTDYKLPDNRPTTSLRHAEAVERLLLHSKAWQHSSTKQSLFLWCKVDKQTCQCLETLIDVWWCHFNNDVKKFQSNTIENYFSLLRWDFCKLPFVVRRKNIIESHYLKLQNITNWFATTT